MNSITIHPPSFGLQSLHYLWRTEEFAHNIMFPRRRKATRRVARKARRVQRKKRVSRMFSVKKTFIDARIAVNCSTTVFGARSFSLTDLPQWPSFVLLYEQYRIDKVTFKFNSLVNSSQMPTPPAGLPTAFTLGMVHTLVDHNDAVAPTSIQAMMNDDAYRGVRSSRTTQRTLAPKFLMDVGAAVAAGSRTGWLSTDTPAIPHYAVKWAFEGGYGIAGYPSFYVEPIITYHISFKDQKN